MNDNDGYMDFDESEIEEFICPITNAPCFFGGGTCEDFGCYRQRAGNYDD